MPTHNKHTHNKHTLFALTKMCLFGEEEDFGKINSLYFSQHWIAKDSFLIIFEKLYNVGLNLTFLGNFLFFKFENQESFSPILQTKNSQRILEKIFKPEKFFSKVINKKSKPYTKVFAYDAQSFTFQN